MDANSAHDDKAVAPRPEVDVRLSRRRLLRRGVAAGAPVIATLASGPVNAGSCVVASGFISTATFNSRHPTGMNPCSGKSPSTWKSTSTTWPCSRSSTYFNAVFSGGLASCKLADGGGSTNPGPTLEWLLNQSQTSMASHVIALYLNARANLTIGTFTTTDVVAIWQNICANNGGYKVNGAPAWDVVRTKDWLKLSWT